MNTRDTVSKFLKLLKIEFPIVQAPMAGISTPEMAAAVSNAGALGSISVGAVDAHQAQVAIRKTQALTDKPINVNVFCHPVSTKDESKESAWIDLLRPKFTQLESTPPKELRVIYKSFIENEELLDVLIAERPAVVSFHFGLPSQWMIDRLKQAGIVLFSSATTVDEGLLNERAGVDVVVGQGYEAGGHRVMFDPRGLDDCLGTFALTRLLAMELTVPVVSAGGIMDGAGILACLELGASAAQIGTAFVSCPESLADATYKRLLQSDAAHHTTMTRVISGRPARSLTTDFTRFGETVDANSIPDYPIAYDAGKALHAAAKAKGESPFGAYWAGQGAPLSRSLLAAELVSTLVSEMHRASCNRPIEFVLE